MTILVIEDGDDPFLTQHLMLGFLAFPADSDVTLRTSYINALKSLSITKNTDLLSRYEQRIIARAFTKILIKGTSVAKIIMNTLYELESGNMAPSWQHHAEMILDDIRTHYSRPLAGVAPVQAWNSTWVQRIPVCPIAVTVFQKMISTKLRPEGLAILPNWGIEAAINAERVYQILASRPIYGIDPAILLRICPASLKGAAVMPLDDSESIIAFEDGPNHLRLPPPAGPALPSVTRKRDPSPRLYEKRAHYFVKPVRSDDASPAFDWDYGRPLIRKGITPIVIPDANILARMLEFMNVFTEWDEFIGSGLDSIFSELIAGPTAFFCPFFAYAECGPSAFKPTQRAVNIMFSKFAPGLVDENTGESDYTLYDSNAVSDAGRTPFWHLSETMKALTAGAYLTFLRASYINRTMEQLPGQVQFFALLNYLSANANFLPGVELEVAKHLFFERRPGTNYGDFGTISAMVKKNFFKRAKNFSVLKSTRLNAARDIAYIRITANHYELEHDPWLLTCDKGIDALLKTVYWQPKKIGAASENMLSVLYDVRSADAYWKKVDQLGSWFSTERREHGLAGTDIDTIYRCISETETKVYEAWSC